MSDEQLWADLLADPSFAVAHYSFMVCTPPNDKISPAWWAQSISTLQPWQLDLLRDMFDRRTDQPTHRFIDGEWWRKL